LDNVNNYDLLSHLVVTLKKRPTIPNVEYDNISIYLLNIMNECWNHEIKHRPTINDILNSMVSKLITIK
jgi:hypothetical protein